MKFGLLADRQIRVFTRILHLFAFEMVFRKCMAMRSELKTKTLKHYIFADINIMNAFVERSCLSTTIDTASVRRITLLPLGCLQRRTLSLLRWTPSSCASRVFFLHYFRLQMTQVLFPTKSLSFTVMSQL